jgi:hypothetical protein
MQAWYLFAMWMDEGFIDSVLGPLFTFLVFLIMAAIVAALAWFGYRRWRMRYGSARWTLTEATISGGLAAAAGSNLFHAGLQYSYRTAGEFYSGYFMVGGVFTSRKDASAAARPWLEKKIFVRYNPARPQESAFLRDDGAPRGSRSFGDQPPASSDMITLSLK